MRNIEENRQQEKKEKADKAARVQKLMTEVDASNKESIKIKAQRREEEKILEQKIIDYQRNKDRIEEEKMAEAARQAAEKEKEL